MQLPVPCNESLPMEQLRKTIQKERIPQYAMIAAAAIDYISYFV